MDAPIIGFYGQTVSWSHNPEARLFAWAMDMCYQEPRNPTWIDHVLEPFRPLMNDPERQQVDGLLGEINPRYQVYHPQEWEWDRRYGATSQALWRLLEAILQRLARFEPVHITSEDQVSVDDLLRAQGGN